MTHNRHVGTHGEFDRWSRAHRIYDMLMRHALHATRNAAILILVAAFITLSGCERRATRVPPYQTPDQTTPTPRSAAQADQKGTHIDAPSRWMRSIEEMGVTIECSLTPLPESEPRATIHTGDDVAVRFRITDATTGVPIPNLNPAAWIDAPDPQASESCQQQIQSFLTGSLSARAEYDLNVFYVLALNDEPSITVVDPLFSYGGTRLLALARLPSPGEDWVLSQNQNDLYVSMPLINQVAIVDTHRWEVAQRVDVPTQPTRLRMQPDEKYLWVSCVAPRDNTPTGIVGVIDTDTLKVVARLPVGTGHHHVAFSNDSAFAFITNDESAVVQVINVQTLQPVATVNLTAGAGGVVFSPVSQNAYVVDGPTGEIAVIDGQTHQLTRHISAKPGLSTINITPSGRFILVANEEQNTVDFIDVASDSIVDTADVGGHPDQIVFTLNLAYIRSRDSETILMIPLDQIGKEGPLSVVDFTGGHTPFGASDNISVADGMAPAPSGLEVVLSNPIDKTIYFYREGMAAPMGEFTNYGREPRAVLVVDRSLNEVEPGVYGTTVNLSRQGHFNLAFLLDVPRVVHCFPLDVENPPGMPIGDDPATPLRIIVSAEQKEVRVGEPVRITYTVTDARTNQPITDLEDLGIVSFSSKNQQLRRWASHVDGGTYAVRFSLAEPGVYYTFCQVPSRGMRYRDSPSVVIKARAKE